MKIIANNYKPGEIVRFIRQYANLTQKELSLNMQKNPFWIRDIERLKNKFSFEDLLKLADDNNCYIVVVDKPTYDKNLKK